EWSARRRVARSIKLPLTPAQRCIPAQCRGAAGYIGHFIAPCRLLFPGTTALYPGTGPLFPGTAPSFPGTARSFPGTDPLFPGPTCPYPGTDPLFPGAADPGPGTGTAPFHAPRALARE